MQEWKFIEFIKTQRLHGPFGANMVRLELVSWISNDKVLLPEVKNEPAGIVIVIVRCRARWVGRAFDPYEVLGVHGTDLPVDAIAVFEARDTREAAEEVERRFNGWELEVLGSNRLSLRNENHTNEH